jgi:hypothetical protein
LRHGATAPSAATNECNLDGVVFGGVDVRKRDARQRGSGDEFAAREEEFPARWLAEVEGIGFSFR